MTGIPVEGRRPLGPHSCAPGILAELVVSKKQTVAAVAATPEPLVRARCSRQREPAESEQLARIPPNCPVVAEDSPHRPRCLICEIKRLRCRASLLSGKPGGPRAPRREPTVSPRVAARGIMDHPKQLKCIGFIVITRRPRPCQPDAWSRRGSPLRRACKGSRVTACEFARQIGKIPGPLLDVGLTGNKSTPIAMGTGRAPPAKFSAVGAPYRLCRPV
jgi:hypothetical protein